MCLALRVGADKILDNDRAFGFEQIPATILAIDFHAITPPHRTHIDNSDVRSA